MQGHRNSICNFNNGRRIHRLRELDQCSSTLDPCTTGVVGHDADGFARSLWLYLYNNVVQDDLSGYILHSQLDGLAVKGCALCQHFSHDSNCNSSGGWSHPGPSRQGNALPSQTPEYLVTSADIVRNHPALTRPAKARMPERNHEDSVSSPSGPFINSRDVAKSHPVQFPPAQVNTSGRRMLNSQSESPSGYFVTTANTGVPSAQPRPANLHMSGHSKGPNVAENSLSGQYLTSAKVKEYQSKSDSSSGSLRSSSGEGKYFKTYTPAIINMSSQADGIDHYKAKNKPNRSAVSKSPGTSEVSAPTVIRRPPSVICHLCGREFGTQSIGIHEKQCLVKWKQENDQLPKHLRRQEPTKPQIAKEMMEPIRGAVKGQYNLDAINDAAFASAQDQYVQCDKCGRTFLPDRLAIHAKSCRGFSRRKP